METCFVTAKYIDLLQEKINKLLKAGWRLQGGFIYTEDGYVQMMVRMRGIKDLV